MAPTLACPIKVGKIYDVQELDKAKTASVPPRFLRGSEESPTFTSIKLESLPLIDLSELKKGNPDELQKLVASCEQWGIFQIINHQIDPDLLESTMNLSMDFFNLPLEVKQKYPMVPGTAEGYGQAFVFSEDQKLDWLNMFAVVTDPHSIRKPSLWPTEPEKFSETVDLYTREMRKLCETVLKLMAISLKLDESVFENMFGEAVQGSRMNYYPPCPRPDLVFGISPHSDGSAITVLQEERGSRPGLQVLKGDEWVSVQPGPNALLVNIGDTLEVLTNGKFKSVEHRAITHNQTHRLSIVTFYAPSYDIELGPIPELLNDNNPPKFRRYNHGDYAKNYLGRKLQCKEALEFTKLDYVPKDL